MVTRPLGRRERSEEREGYTMTQHFLLGRDHSTSLCGKQLESHGVPSLNDGGSSILDVLILFFKTDRIGRKVTIIHNLYKVYRGK